MRIIQNHFSGTLPQIDVKMKFISRLMCVFFFFCPAATVSIVWLATHSNWAGKNIGSHPFLVCFFGSLLEVKSCLSCTSAFWHQCLSLWKSPHQPRAASLRSWLSLFTLLTVDFMHLRSHCAASWDFFWKLKPFKFTKHSPPSYLRVSADDKDGKPSPSWCKNSRLFLISHYLCELSRQLQFYSWIKKKNPAPQRFFRLVRWPAYMELSGWVSTQSVPVDFFERGRPAETPCGFLLLSQTRWHSSLSPGSRRALQGGRRNKRPYANGSRQNQPL